MNPARWKPEIPSDGLALLKLGYILEESRPNVCNDMKLHFWRMFSEKVCRLSHKALTTRRRKGITTKLIHYSRDMDGRLGY